MKNSDTIVKSMNIIVPLAHKWSTVCLLRILALLFLRAKFNYYFCFVFVFLSSNIFVAQLSSIQYSVIYCNTFHPSTSITFTFYLSFHLVLPLLLFLLWIRLSYASATVLRISVFVFKIPQFSHRQSFTIFFLSSSFPFLVNKYYRINLLILKSVKSPAMPMLFHKEMLIERLKWIKDMIFIHFSSLFVCLLSHKYRTWIFSFYLNRNFSFTEKLFKLNFIAFQLPLNSTLCKMSSTKRNDMVWFV